MCWCSGIRDGRYVHQVLGTGRLTVPSTCQGRRCACEIRTRYTGDESLVHIPDGLARFDNIVILKAGEQLVELPAEGCDA